MEEEFQEELNASRVLSKFKASRVKSLELLFDLLIRTNHFWRLTSSFPTQLKLQSAPFRNAGLVEGGDAERRLHPQIWMVYRASRMSEQQLPSPPPF